MAPVWSPAPTYGKLFWVLSAPPSDGIVDDGGTLEINLKNAAGGVETLRWFDCIPSRSKLWHLLGGSGRVVCLALGSWFPSSPVLGVALSSEIANQKLGNEMVWNFRRSDGMIVPTTESNNTVGLGPFGQSVALDVFI